MEALLAARGVDSSVLRALTSSLDASPAGASRHSSSPTRSSYAALPLSTPSAVPAPLRGPASPLAAELCRDLTEALSLDTLTLPLSVPPSRGDLLERSRIALGAQRELLVSQARAASVAESAASAADERAASASDTIAVLREALAAAETAHARCPRTLSRALDEVKRLEGVAAAAEDARLAAERSAAETRSSLDALSSALRAAGVRLDLDARAAQQTVAAAEARATAADAAMALALERAAAAEAREAAGALARATAPPPVCEVCVQAAAATAATALASAAQLKAVEARAAAAEARALAAEALAERIAAEGFAREAGNAARAEALRVEAVVSAPNADSDASQLASLVQEIRVAGLLTSQLMFFVDCTKSNATNPNLSFGGRSLHDVSSGERNPYQRVIEIFGHFLAPFDEDGQIPLYGFGDRTCESHSVFPFHFAGGWSTEESRMVPEGFCNGLDAVLKAYDSKISSVTLAGPTSFAPAIKKAIEHCRKVTPREFTIALIIADGQVDSKVETINAIIEASSYPISIICIGVGDGPWDKMSHFDEELHTTSWNGLSQKLCAKRLGALQHLESARFLTPLPQPPLFFSVASATIFTLPNSSGSSGRPLSGGEISRRPSPSTRCQSCRCNLLRPSGSGSLSEK